MSSVTRMIMPPPPVVAVAGWLVPGIGYVLIGQRLRGVVVGLTILAMFAGGLLIGGMRVVDSAVIESVKDRKEREASEASARREVERDKNAVYAPPSIVVRTLQKPWFIGQFFAGPAALAANYVGTTWGGDAGSPYSHARVYEIGVLYAAVAGMLNLMAIIDSAYRASNGGAR